MDSHTLRTLDRLEIVETGRRRRWTEDEKVRIVLESMAGPRLVAPTARRHNISRSMLVLWRRTFKAAASGESRPAFVQAVVAAPTLSPIAAAAQLSEDVSRPSRIEIVLAHGRRIIVEEHVDPAALSRVLDVVERR